MANESDRAGLIGAALGAFFTCILAGIWLRLILGPSKPLLPLIQKKNQHEHELKELPPRRNRGLDLERGVVGGESQLSDPDIFMIPGADAGGESNPSTYHGTPMVNSITGEQHSKKVQSSPKLRLKFIDAVAESYTGDRDDPRSDKEHTMSEATPVHEDDDMLLMHPGVSLSQGGSKRSSQRTSFLSDPFDLSHFLSRRSGSHAPEPEGTQVHVGSDALPAMPKPVVTQKTHGYSISRRPILLDVSSNNAPSNTDFLPDPSTFEAEDITISSKDEVATQWKPAQPKVSRYRGLSATRSDQKPQLLSPSQSHIDIDHVAPQNTGPLPTILPPLPALETFTVSTRPDSWEDFSSTGEKDTDDGPAEWKSQVCSTVAEPQQAEAFQELHVEADKGPNLGPFDPNPRILEQKASLPGRKSKFVEVDVDTVPVGVSRELGLVLKGVELFREGARMPTILTSYGEVESPDKEGEGLEYA